MYDIEYNLSRLDDDDVAPRERSQERFCFMRIV